MAIIIDPAVSRELYGDTFNNIGVLQVDVTISESHQYDSQVTDKPVEDGRNVNDNVILLAPEITIRGVLTDERLGTSFAEKWQALLDLRASREAFAVTTSLGTYTDMIFTSLRCDREVSTAGAVFFDATIKNIYIISSETAQVPVRALPADALGQKSPAQDQGKKQGDGTEDTTKTRRSLAASLADKVL